MKLCHFLQKSAIWDSAKWTRQYGIRESGTNSIYKSRSNAKFGTYLKKCVFSHVYASYLFTEHMF
jgi:hypothetical protein